MNPSVQPSGFDLPVRRHIPVKFVEVRHECQIHQVARTALTSTALTSGQSLVESRMIHTSIQIGICAAKPK